MADPIYPHASEPPVYPKVTQKLRRTPRDRFPIGPFVRPVGTENFTLSCNCGHTFLPPWGERRRFEHAPVESATPGYVFVWSGVQVACPKCGGANVLKFPKGPPGGGHLTCYGDEAYRWLSNQNKLIYVYSFISLKPVYGLTVKAEWQAVKRRLRPLAEPDQWALHISDIRNPKWRGKNGSPLTTEEVDAQLRSFLIFLNRRPEHRWICISIQEQTQKPSRLVSAGKIEQETGASTLVSALFAITHYQTSIGNQLDFVLEAQSLSHQKNQIDFFVEEIGRGLRQDLVYLWSCHSTYVGLPTTAPKGQFPELEMADLLAFFTARHLQQRRIGKSAEIVPDQFGDVLWVVTNERETQTRFTTGLPDDLRATYQRSG